MDANKNSVIRVHSRFVRGLLDSASGCGRSGLTLTMSYNYAPQDISLCLSQERVAFGWMPIAALFSGQTTVKQALDAWQNESLKHPEDEGYTVRGE